jgi:exonuclease SbcC
MHKIHLKTLRFSNILSYGGNVNEVVFGDGLTWVKGPNGAGKSTIIEALNFALFSGSYRNITKSELRNTANKGKLKVFLEFDREDSKGTVNYTIEREMGKGATKTIIHKDNVEQNKEAGMTQKFLEGEVFGFNQNIFENIISLNTIETTPFIDMDPGTKRKLIESMLTLQIDKFKDINKKALKLAQTKFESSKSDVVKYGKDVEELSSMIEKLKQEQTDDIDELNEQIVELKDSITMSNAEIDDKSNVYDDIIAQGKDKSDELNKLPNYASEIDEIKDIKQLINELSKLKPKRKEKYDASKEALVTYRTLSSESTLYTEIDADDIKAKRKALSEQEKLKGGYEGAYKLTDDKRLDIESKGKELKAGVPCPTCAKPSTEEDMEALRIDYRIKWKSAKDALAIHQGLINSSTKIIDKLNIEIDDMEAKAIEYDKYYTKLNIAKTDSERIQAEYLEINDEYIECAKKIADAGHSKSTIEDLDNKIDVLNDGSNSRTLLEGVVSNLRSDARVVNTEIENINRTIAAFESSIASIQSKIDKKKKQSDDDSVTLLENKIKGTKDDYNRAKERVTKYSDEISITEYIETMYDDAGIKKIVLGIFVPNLNKAIAHNMDLFNLPFSIEFNDAMDLRFESRFGLAPSYKALSQGQKRKLNFAIAVAFRDFVTSIADFKINILFLDEVLDISTDEEALEHMIQLLKTKVPEIGGIYLMTHRGEQFSEYFDNCILVQNDGRYSSLEMKELPNSSAY